MMQSLILLAILAAAYLLARWLEKRRQGRPARVRSRAKWSDPLDEPLLYLGSRDPFTLRDLLNGGVCILGRTGSGKTSSSGKAFGEAIVRRKSGGLLLAAKRSDVPMWRSIFESAGRGGDLLLFGPDHPLRFNFLAEEMRTGGSTRSITRLITVIGETLRSEGNDGREGADFWQREEQRRMANAVEVVKQAKGLVTASDLHRFVTSAATSPEMLESKAWRGSFHYECIEEASNRAKTPVQEHDFNLAFDYEIHEFPLMADRTRSSIMTGVQGTLHVFNTGTVRELVSTTTNVTPADLMAGKWLLIDMPPSEYGDEGLLIASGWKYLFQRAVLRRDPKPGDAPVGIWCDEYHLFCNRFDAAYLAQSRGHLGFMCVLTQGVSSLYGKLPGETGRHQADSLLGNFAHAVVHACDPVTANWAASKLGRTLQNFVGSSMQPPQDLWQDLAGGYAVSPSTSEQYESVLQPNAFMNGLRTGGPGCDHTCDAIVLRSGMPFASTGENWLWVPFRQG